MAGGVDYAAFARDWQDAWNSHDLTRILSHYSDNIVFRSAKAAALVGQGTVYGKADLRAYWAKALRQQPELRFDVIDVFGGHQMTVITYRNHRGIRAAETLRFDASGLVVEASACHCHSDS